MCCAAVEFSAQSALRSRLQDKLMTKNKRYDFESAVNVFVICFVLSFYTNFDLCHMTGGGRGVGGWVTF